MPTKRKFTARFPTAKIKRIMQVDDDVGKISATVPSVVSCALETCISQLVTKAYELALSRNSRTVTPSHLKQVIEEIQEFEFAQELVRKVPILKPMKVSSSLDNGDCAGAECIPDSPNGLCGLENTMSTPGDLGVVKKRGRPKKSINPAQEITQPKKKRRRKTDLKDDDPGELGASNLLEREPEIIMDSSSSTE